jgi:SAM-dependent methyltransferase
MDIDIYKNMSKIESTHWWFCGRRDVVRFLLRRFSSRTEKILDVGCGTGGNLSMLAEFGVVEGIEPNQFARDFANGKGEGKVYDGDLPGNIDLENETFSVISMLDVLEHIEQDYEALSEISNKLKNNGIILITVPAFNFLMSEHDRRHHHCRRYVKSGLLEIVSRAGFEIKYASYYSSILFPLAFLQRVVFGRVFGFNMSSADKVPSRFINWILYKVFSFEAILLRYIKFPIGLSIVVVGRKNLIVDCQ